MPHTHDTPLAGCPRRRPTEPFHDVVLAYDVPNDEYFVACLTCGCEGMRCKDEITATDTWTQREDLSSDVCKRT